MVSARLRYRVQAKVDESLRSLEKFEQWVVDDAIKALSQNRTLPEEEAIEQYLFNHYYGPEINTDLSKERLRQILVGGRKIANVLYAYFGERFLLVGSNSAQRVMNLFINITQFIESKWTNSEAPHKHEMLQEVKKTMGRYHDAAKEFNGKQLSVVYYPAFVETCRHARKLSYFRPYWMGSEPSA